ncbi:xanthine dehydrogenase family protein subunit M [Bradyrhizobium jicamae]|uniref:FAD binding domain-containing protein n=1 Tax=Bradyrhizobium jicamae TaxID=280332 RepID=UPI001BAD205B|nr:xanthine dehydrogenase family protein subunit M [Bradyrhizobium jicamae]MBR0756624.1 xanthine dehydrogenase family protein subunit M [Bradyrhizobium jicamae]
MKAAAFAYARATSVANALELLAAHGDRAKVLSGGQSLMPAMNLRLVTPELIVDIGALSELRGISVEGKLLVVGGLTRHVDLERSADIAKHAPLLSEAIAHVAHPAIRNRGTIGGSLAHADPASELPACMLALGATIVVRGSRGERRVAAQDFFKGIYETVLAPDELLVSVEIPIAPEGSSHFFEELARRQGDYAIAGLAAQAVVRNDVFADLQLAFFAVGDRPLLAECATRLINVTVTADLLSEAADALALQLEPQEDQQASPAMRRHLARVLLMRGVASLLGRLNLRNGAGE